MTTLDHVAALQSLSDRELIAETHRLVDCDRQATAHVIAALMVVDARQLYLAAGCRSLFTYCTEVLHFSEHAAYGRIEAARAAGRFPAILDLLANGSLTLTAVGLLASYLMPDNHSGLLAAARHKSKREVEHIVAASRRCARCRPFPRRCGSCRRPSRSRPRSAPTLFCRSQRRQDR